MFIRYGHLYHQVFAKVWGLPRFLVFKFFRYLSVAHEHVGWVLVGFFFITIRGLRDVQVKGFTGLISSLVRPLRLMSLRIRLGQRRVRNVFGVFLMFRRVQGYLFPLLWVRGFLVLFRSHEGAFYAIGPIVLTLVRHKHGCFCNLRLVTRTISMTSYDFGFICVPGPRCQGQGNLSVMLGVYRFFGCVIS